MVQFTPTGRHLVEFCSSHLSTSNGTIALPPDAPFAHRLQYFLVKRRARTLIRLVTRSIAKKRLFEFHAILGSFHYEMTSLWDELLVFIVIYRTSLWVGQEKILTEQEKTNDVLAIFVSEVNALYSMPLSSLCRKIEHLRQATITELPFTAARTRQKKASAEEKRVNNNPVV